jgi:hopanoid biosynthesis associated protein HpnK
VKRLLLVTADDFGLTEGVNRAVVHSHREGIVTSASLLAVGRAYSSAVRLARVNPSLAVGVHLAAVGEDPPLLDPAAIPSLVDRSGQLPLSYRTFLRRAALGKVDVADVRREFQAQVQRVVDDGLVPSHLDTHQHLHLWPPVARVVTELAKDYGIPAVRLPRSHRRSAVSAGVNILSQQLSRRLDAAALDYTDDFAGLDEAGSLDRSFEHALDRVLTRRHAETVEINTHPGEAGDADLARFPWGYRWDRELDLLISRSTRELVDQYDFTLRSWVDLVAGR